MEVRCGEYPIPENYKYLEIPIPEFPKNSPYTYELQGDVYIREDQWEVAQFLVNVELRQPEKGGFYIEYRDGIGRMPRRVLQLKKHRGSGVHP